MAFSPPPLESDNAEPKKRPRRARLGEECVAGAACSVRSAIIKAPDGMEVESRLWSRNGAGFRGHSPSILRTRDRGTLAHLAELRATALTRRNRLPGRSGRRRPGMIRPGPSLAACFRVGADVADDRDARSLAECRYRPVSLRRGF